MGELHISKKHLLDLVRTDCNALGEYGYIIGDKPLGFELLKIDGSVYRYFSDGLKQDREIVLEAVKSRGIVLGAVPNELKYDEEIILAAINSSKEALKYVPVDVPNYRELALKIVADNGENLEFVSTDSPDYEEIACVALDKAYCAFNFSDYDMLSIDDPHAAEFRVNEYYSILSKIPEDKQSTILQQLDSKYSEKIEEVKSRATR